MKKTAIDYLCIMFGTFMLAYAIIAFWAPHSLVTGGVSGTAIVILEYSYILLGFTIPVWVTNLALNIPLFIVGYKSIPRHHLLRSGFAAGFMSFALYLAEYLPVPETDLFLGAVFGGVIAGAGIGLVFRSQATTGGSTLAAVIVKRVFLKHISSGKIMLGIDTTIVLIGLVIFGPVAAMYAVIAIFVCSKIIDVVNEGLSFGKSAYIITSKPHEISTEVIKTVGRGCTMVTTKGMFTMQEQPMLICVLKPKQLAMLKQVVYGIDEKAFVFVSDVREVLGEGFLEAKKDM